MLAHGAAATPLHVLFPSIRDARVAPNSTTHMGTNVTANRRLTGSRGSVSRYLRSPLNKTVS